MSDVGKLLCVGIRGAEPGSDPLESDLQACREAGVGGVILFSVDVPKYETLRAAGLDDASARRGAPRNVKDPRQLRGLVDHIREVLGADVFIAIDQEGGRVSRLDPEWGFRADLSAREFARKSVAEREESAREQAAQLRRLGIDFNLAPCVDVEVEPRNPIISRLDRSFGSGGERIVECARTIIAAHRAQGIATCLKHFPGHGSSLADTHLGMVDITDSWQRDVELLPYRQLCKEPGVAVMMAHVVHRGLDPQDPLTLSRSAIGDLLRDQIGFQGVVVSDSIDMRAIADRWGPEEACVRAIGAGVDLVIDGFNLTERGPEHPAHGLRSALERALVEGRITGGADRIESSLQRLRALRQSIEVAP